jgi:hypothetical protein
MAARRLILILPILLALWAPSARAMDAAMVLRLQGEAWADARPLAVGDPLRVGELLKTGPGARLEVRFADGMDLVLGEAAGMRVDAFAWVPETAGGSAKLFLESGAFLLETGQVGKLPDHPLEVRTPIASVGVRGTRFWGGPLGSLFDLLLLEGRVVVRSAGGVVELGQPGQGTSLSGPDEPPHQPTNWGDERVKRAFATVSFSP